MAISQKDEMVIRLKAMEDGYVAQYYVIQDGSFDTPKTNISQQLLNRLNEAAGDVFQQRISADKENLKTEVSAAIDTYFDV